MSRPIAYENAEILALEGLGWLAADTARLQAFLELSGLDPTTLRQSAASPDMAAAVLEFLLGHEALLLRFCDDSGVLPKDVHLARLRLEGMV